MANAGRVSTQKLMNLLTAPEGLSASVAAIAAAENLSLDPPGIHQVLAQNVAAEVIERSCAIRYPMLHVYCDRLENQQREKFRTFSGKARLVIEVRVSQDRMEGIEQLLQLHVEAVTRILDENRGDWGGCMFYGGGYDAVFGPVKKGGKNFLQIAKVSIDVDVSID